MKMEICILIRRKSIQKETRSEKLLKYIANFIQGKKTAWDSKAQLRSEFLMLDDVFEASDKESALFEFIESWYNNHSEYAWYDSHKSSSDTYCGYWSFESAAISIIIGINDTKLRDSEYYPFF